MGPIPFGISPYTVIGLEDKTILTCAFKNVYNILIYEDVYMFPTLSTEGLMTDPATLPTEEFQQGQQVVNLYCDGWCFLFYLFAIVWECLVLFTL